MVDHYVGGTQEQSTKNWQVVAIVGLEGVDSDVADRCIHLHSAISSDISVGND